MKVGCSHSQLFPSTLLTPSSPDQHPFPTKLSQKSQYSNILSKKLKKTFYRLTVRSPLFLASENNPTHTPITIPSSPSSQELHTNPKLNQKVKKANSKDRLRILLFLLLLQLLRNNAIYATQCPVQCAHTQYSSPFAHTLLTSPLSAANHNKKMEKSSSIPGLLPKSSLISTLVFPSSFKKQPELTIQTNTTKHQNKTPKQTETKSNVTKGNHSTLRERERAHLNTQTRRRASASSWAKQKRWRSASDISPNALKIEPDC